MKVAELFAYIGVVTDEQKAKDFFNVLKEGQNILFGVATMAVGTSLGIGAMLNKAMDAALALAHFEAQTGLSAQTLQAWQHVGEGMGLTADEVTSSIVALNKNLAMVKIGQGNIAPFQMLGISVGQDAWGVLRQLRKIMGTKAYNPQTISAIMEQMGLSPAMVKVLQLSNAEFDKMANRSAIITPAQIEAALKFNAALKELGQTITYLFETAFAQLAPVMTDLLAKTEEWIKLNQKDLKAGIVQATAAFGSMMGEVKGAFDLINKITTATIGWKNAVLALGAAFAFIHPVYGVLILIVDALNEINKAMNGVGSWKDKLNDFMTGKGGLWSQAFSLPTKLGMWLGGALQGSAQSNGVSQPVYMQPLSLATSPGVGTIQLTQNIYSTASPREVADLTAQAIKRLVNQASVQVPRVR